jgi:hypothetical protein
MTEHFRRGTVLASVLQCVDGVVGCLPSKHKALSSNTVYTTHTHTHTHSVV